MRVHGHASGAPTWAAAVNPVRDAVMRTLGTESQAWPVYNRLPIDSTDMAVVMAADEAARACYAICALYMSAQAIILAIDTMADGYGIQRPQGATDAEIIARAVDKSWWLRALRKELARRFENEAIATGATGPRTDPYISNQSAARQAKRNRENQALLEATIVRNGAGQEYTLAQLAALGMGNKQLRRGELMTRIAGFEAVSKILDHKAVFFTMTCPSKFHSTGGTNPKYSGASPRQAQAYLCKVWARIRASLKRQGVSPYGFRVAEPHTDGCPHWHMLFFIEASHRAALEATIRRHAMREDGDEAGAEKYRVDVKAIKTGAGMSAAGYIAKYIAKNIDGHGVGQHTSIENGETVNVNDATIDGKNLSPSDRVGYWAQLHGIRQFQQIGGAPVGVWRELRRIKAETIVDAPAVIRSAWEAAQKIDTGETDEAGAAIYRGADYGAFVLAMGGPGIGRQGRIGIARSVVVIAGRYATYEAEKPAGVYATQGTYQLFASVRHTWERVGIKRAVAVGFDLPRSPVNNCTRTAQPGENAPWFGENRPEIKNFSSPLVAEFKNYRENDHEFDLERYRGNLAAGMPRIYGEKSDEKQPPALPESGKGRRYEYENGRLVGVVHD